MICDDQAVVLEGLAAILGTVLHIEVVGLAGHGVPGLGKDMTSSEFIAGLTDDELVEFIKMGRDPSDPLNTPAWPCRPKGATPPSATRICIILRLIFVAFKNDRGHALFLHGYGITGLAKGNGGEAERQPCDPASPPTPQEATG